MVQLKRKVTLKQKQPIQTNKDSGKKKRILWLSSVALIVIISAATFFLFSKMNNNINTNILAEAESVIDNTVDSLENNETKETVLPADSILATAEIDSVINNTIPKKTTKEETVDSSTEKTQSFPYKEGEKYIAYQFEFNKKSFSEPNEDMLKLANTLKSFPDMKIAITAYTDNVGSVVYNKALSDLRAKAIFDFLISQGIDEKRLSYKGMGISSKFENATLEGRQKNRRAEFKLIK